MIERKSLTWFLAITFIFSWILFLVPLTFTNMDAAQKQLSTQGLWAIAMWGPGIAAIITTLFVEKKSFSNLRLNTLGAKRFYLWAWILPIALVIIAGVLTLLFGAAKLDLNFTMISDAMASAGKEVDVPVGVIVAAQILFAFTLAPFINSIFTLGEELGWRGYLLPKLMPLGQRNAIIISGAVWGFWHAPAIVQGHNYPGYPILGSFMMIVFCILFGTILSWLTLNTKSPWGAALAHGSVNAVAGLPILFFQPGFNMTIGGTLASLIGWIGMIIFIAWLVRTKRLPLQDQIGNGQADPRQE